MLCFTSNENCHFSSGKTVTTPNWLLISFGKNTFRKQNHGNRRRNKLQQQQLILEIVEDFASEDKTLEIFRDFALFLHFLNFFFSFPHFSSFSSFSLYFLHISSCLLFFPQFSSLFFIFYVFSSFFCVSCFSFI